jgi:hypothetical protein
MYMLRLISGVLHEARGPRVFDEALDLRVGELAVLVPLVGCLLALSAWPAAVTENLFAGSDVRQGLAVVEVMDLFAAGAPPEGDAIPLDEGCLLSNAGPPGPQSLARLLSNTCEDNGWTTYPPDGEPE